MPTIIHRILNGFAALLLLTLSLQAQAQQIVDYKGSQAPEGTRTNPWQTIAAGTCNPDTVLIRPGNYSETLTLNKRMVLKSDGPGTVVIGQVKNRPHTELLVVTYNTHLFGKEMFGLKTFLDRTRAQLIADALKAERADVVGLQEVWDDELAAEILRRSDRYPYSYYNNARASAFDYLGSGLLLLSRHPLHNPSLTFYQAEAGLKESRASKGFLQAMIEKDGFMFGVFVTHTQSAHDNSDVAARAKQLRQLGDQITLYRIQHPNAEVIAMGDFNVKGPIAGAKKEDYGEYFNTLLTNMTLLVDFPASLFSHPKMLDAWLNTPCTASVGNLARTSGSDNDLAHVFDDIEDDRLDYIFYSTGTAFDMFPARAQVRRNYKTSPPLTDGADSSKDVSDHYALLSEFKVWQKN